MSKKFDSHPAPEVEEDVDGDGDGQQQAVEAHAAAAAAAAFGEVLVHRSRVEQTEERHDWDEAHHGGQRQHDGGQLGDVRQHRWLFRICLVILQRLLLLHWCSWWVWVFLQQSRLLRDHVRNAINDGIGDAKLVVDQLVGFRLIPAEKQKDSSHKTQATYFCVESQKGTNHITKVEMSVFSKSHTTCQLVVNDVKIRADKE